MAFCREERVHPFRLVSELSSFSKSCIFFLWFIKKKKKLSWINFNLRQKLQKNSSCIPLTQLCCCSATNSCLILFNPMNWRIPGFPVLHHLLEFAQTHVHWISDAIQPSHPLSPSSPPTLNLSQHQGLSQWVGSLHQVAKVLYLPLQHESFQWIFKIDFL